MLTFALPDELFTNTRTVRHKLCRFLRWQLLPQLNRRALGFRARHRAVEDLVADGLPQRKPPIAPTPFA